jgi:hypothetical protein
MPQAEHLEATMQGRKICDNEAVWQKSKTCIKAMKQDEK